MSEKLVVLCASTGGPSIIKDVLASVHTLSFPVVVVQHMQEDILPFFAQDLKSSLKIPVCTSPCFVAMQNPSVIVLCRSSVLLEHRDGGYEIKTDESGQKYVPDINRFLFSLSQTSLAVKSEVFIMTGIGDDGVEGALKLHQRGAKIFAQDEESSPVYGMPKAALESGVVDGVFSVEKIKEYLRG